MFWFIQTILLNIIEYTYKTALIESQLKKINTAIFLKKEIILRVYIIFFTKWYICALKYAYLKN